MPSMEGTDAVLSGLSLDDTGRESLRRFLDLCRERGLLSRSADLHPHDDNTGLNDEVTLLRFMRGRSFDVDGAMRQFEEALAIRDAAGAVASYESTDIQDFEKTRKMYPHWSGKRDKLGLPICVFDLDCLDSATLSSYDKSRNMKIYPESTVTSDATQRAIVFHDYLTRFVLPLCSAIRDRPNPDRPITSAVYLVNVSSLSLRQAWSLKTYAQDVSQLLATCYPEVIDRVYVLNAPSYFAKIWGFLSKWIDPRTASKLQVIPPTDTLPALLTTIDIESIPVKHGGHCVFQHGLVPHLDDNITQMLAWGPSSNEELPIGPIKWVTDPKNGKGLVAIGTVEGVKRQATVGFVKSVM